VYNVGYQNFEAQWFWMRRCCRSCFGCPVQCCLSRSGGAKENQLNKGLVCRGAFAPGCGGSRGGKGLSLFDWKDYFVELSWLNLIGMNGYFVR